MAAVDALAAFGVAATLKWPNDVLVADEKVGGILVESAIEDGAPSFVVAGIGLNVLQTAGELPLTAYPATSVWLATGCVLDREALAASLLDALDARYRAWLERPGELFLEWRSALSTLGRDVVIVGGGEAIAGVARDVDPDGSLWVDTPAGARRATSGEVSLRAR